MQQYRAAMARALPAPLGAMLLDSSEVVAAVAPDRDWSPKTVKTLLSLLQAEVDKHTGKDKSKS